MPEFAGVQMQQLEGIPSLRETPTGWLVFIFTPQSMLLPVALESRGIESICSKGSGENTVGHSWKHPALRRHQISR